MSSMSAITRRDFFKYSAAISAQAAFLASGLARAGDATAAGWPDLAVARGDSPARNCLAALEAMGGLGRFVRAGDRVAIKPNPVGRNRPEDAINTHPDLVAAVIRECVRLGAKDVFVLSHDGARSFAGNGLATAIEQAGGVLRGIEEEAQYREIIVPRGRILRRERVAADLLDADVFINMPIAKHHAGSEVTLSMKNLMGINWDRLRFHRTDLHQCIAELAATVRPNLIIMDANYVLMTNGPAGPGEVRRGRQVIAGTDPVAVDAFTTRAFWGDPLRVRHIRTAYDLGAGEIDLARLAIKEFDA